MVSKDAVVTHIIQESGCLAILLYIWITFMLLSVFRYDEGVGLLHLDPSQSQSGLVCFGVL